MVKKRSEKSGIHSFMTTLVDTGDGTGDALVPLSDEVLEAIGIGEGDTVELAIENGAIVIRRSEQRD